jgi:hypothetical protein
MELSSQVWLHGAAESSLENAIDHFMESIMALNVISSKSPRTELKSDRKLFEWLTTRMRETEPTRLYPKTLVEVAEFVVANIAKDIVDRDVVKAFDPGRLNRAATLAPGSALGAVFQMMADGQEQCPASETLVEFCAFVLETLSDEPLSLPDANLMAIEALGLSDYGAFRMIRRDNKVYLVTTRAGQAALNIRVEVEIAGPRPDEI